MIASYSFYLQGKGVIFELKSKNKAKYDLGHNLG